MRTMTAPADTRQRILEAATTRFLDRGYDATSLREIAEDLAITKAAVYYHFPSKEDILRAVLDPLTGLFERSWDHLGEVLHAPDPVGAWAVMLEDTVRELAPFRLLLSVLQRNRQAVIDLHLIPGDPLREDSAHAETHDRIDVVLAQLDLPVTDRIRMGCAIAALTGLDDWAPRLFASLDDETYVTEMIAITRAILGRPVTAPAE